MTGRSGESRLACGHGRFADQTFAFVEVRFLFADIDDDLWRAGCALVVPPTCWSRMRPRSGSIRGHFFATAKSEDGDSGVYDLKHWNSYPGAADIVCRIVSGVSNRLAI